MSLATAFIAEWIHVNLGRNTAQHEAVAQLSGRLSEESLKSETLMQSVAEGVMVVNTDRQIELFNPSAVRQTGWDAGSAHGIDYRLVLNLRDAKGNKLDDNSDPFARLWQSGKGLVLNDLTMETKGGHKVAINLSLSPMFDKDNHINGGIALFRDISDEKEIERQRNEFISTASHEMRTPVAAIEGYLSLAMNASVATIDDRAKQYLEKAHSSTQHLGELFRDLLSITKMEDNRQMTEEVFDLTALAKDVVGDLKFEADKKGIELHFGLQEQHVRGDNVVMPIYAVKANPQRIREVLMNLIENALKFTPQGAIRITIGGTNEKVEVHVIDSGIGIAAEDIGHLFQKFYRIDSSATRTIGGTGLGLYLCRSIIERAGGQIWVESKLGQGSAFKISLPRLTSEQITKPAATLPAPASAAAVPASVPAPATPPVQPAPPVVEKAPSPTPAPRSIPVSVPVTAVVSAPSSVASAAPVMGASAPAGIPAGGPTAMRAGRMITDIQRPGAVR
jgi:PAS domain S-box-containing protein